jgi:hypothetical protein
VKPKLRFAVAAGALAVAFTLALAACGGNSDSDGVASLTDTTGESTTESQGSGGGGAAGREEFRKAQLEYAKCMREHGVDMPDPVNGELELKSDRRDQKKVSKAQEACGPILEDAAPPLSEEQQAELREAALEYAKCMREHGIDMPDPQFPEGGGTLMRMPQGAENDPQFEEAQKACQPILKDAKRDQPSGEGGPS